MLVQCLFGNAVIAILSVFLTISYLRDGQLILPTAEAISVWFNAHPRCNRRLCKPLNRFLKTVHSGPKISTPVLILR